MLTQEHILSFLKQNKSQFHQDFGVDRIALFGSFAAGNQKAESDVDILVSFRPDTTDIHDKKTALRSLLTQTFHRNVDLCSEKYIKPYFRKQILKEALYV